MVAVCGECHSVFLSNDGSLYAVGKNNCLQLGLGEKQDYSFPQQVSSLPSIMNVSCGSLFTACVDYNGSLWVFGKASEIGLDQLGDVVHASPQQVEGLPSIQSVVCGDEFTICKSTEKKLYGFGDNSAGQLGLGHCEKKVSRPTQIILNENILQIACGNRHTLFLTEEGSILCCGNNYSGQLGLGNQLGETLLVNSNITKIDSLSSICQIACGYFHSLALDDEGQVFSFGCNSSGQLGSGKIYSTNRFPHKVQICRIVYISCGRTQSRFLDEDKVMWTCGYNGSYGSLGLGHTKMEVTTPEKFSIQNISAISQGERSYHCFVKDEYGTVFGFGNNVNNRLGINHKTSIPNPIELPSEFSEVFGVPNYSRAKSARK